MSRESLEDRFERMPVGKEVRDDGGPERGPASPSVVGIYTSPAKDEPIQRRRSVVATAGVGLDGDRYSVGVEMGTYSGSKIPENWRNITIISLSGIEEARHDLESQGMSGFDDSETRRNVVVAGVSAEQLNALVEGNQSVWLGDVEVRVMKLAPPCNVPSAQYEKPGFKKAFDGRGGVRGTIVNSGVIRQGDGVNFQPLQGDRRSYPYDFHQSPSLARP